MIRVSRRAHGHEDRAGDPLDGLVNLFDLGIVLSVAFLLAALSSLDLDSALTDGTVQQRQERAQEQVQQQREEQPRQQEIRDRVVVPDDAVVEDVPVRGQRVVGRGEQVGQVYRLADGRLVYVVPPGSSDGAGARQGAS